MIDYDDIEDEGFMSEVLSSKLKEAISSSPFELVLIFEDSDEVNDADLLLESVFPKDEVDDYRLGTLFCSNKQPLAIACISNGIVYGVATMTIGKGEAELICLAVDKEKRGSKVGSVLMVAINDLASALKVEKLSLISSPNGFHFYESFGFTEMPMQVFEVQIPIDKETVNGKLIAFEQLHSTKKRKRPCETSNEKGDRVKRRDTKQRDVTTFFSDSKGGNLINSRQIYSSTSVLAK